MIVFSVGVGVDVIDPRSELLVQARRLQALSRSARRSHRSDVRAGAIDITDRIGERRHRDEEVRKSLRTGPHDPIVHRGHDPGGRGDCCVSCVDCGEKQLVRHHLGRAGLVEEPLVDVQGFTWIGESTACRQRCRRAERVVAEIRCRSLEDVSCDSFRLVVAAGQRQMPCPVALREVERPMIPGRTGDHRGLVDQFERTVGIAYRRP